MIGNSINMGKVETCYFYIQYTEIFRAALMQQLDKIGDSQKQEERVRCFQYQFSIKLFIPAFRFINIFKQFKAYL